MQGGGLSGGRGERSVLGDPFFWWLLGRRQLAGVSFLFVPEKEGLNGCLPFPKKEEEIK